MDWESHRRGRGLIIIIISIKGWGEGSGQTSETNHINHHERCSSAEAEGWETGFFLFFTWVGFGDGNGIGPGMNELYGNGWLRVTVCSRCLWRERESWEGRRRRGRGSSVVDRVGWVG